MIMLTRCLRATAWMAVFYGFFAGVAYQILIGPDARIAVLLGLDPVGSPAIATAAVAAALMVGMACLLFVGSLPFVATWSGLSAASSAIRRRPGSPWQDAGTLLSCTALLATWTTLYGATPFWLAWDALIVVGIACSAWNLISHLPRRENRHV